MDSNTGSARWTIGRYENGVAVWSHPATGDLTELAAVNLIERLAGLQAGDGIPRKARKAALDGALRSYVAGEGTTFVACLFPVAV